MAELTLIVTSSADFAGRLARLGEQRALDRLARRQRSEVVRVLDARHEPLRGMDADYSRLVSYAVLIPRSDPNPTTYAIIQRGGIVLEILTHHHTLDDRIVIDVAREALRRVRDAPAATEDQGQ